MLLIISTMLATLLFTIDTTVANVALPHMQGSLQATQEQLGWVLTGYIVASAVVTPLAGFLATRVGVRPIIMVSIAGFTLSSALCGAATSLEQIVAFRILQGICGAALVPLSQVTLLAAFPREQQAKATALWGIGVMIGPIVGPPLGGYLTEYFGWRSVFYINVPVGAFALLGTWLSPYETPRDPSRRFDALGYGLLALSLGLSQLCLDRGNDQGWFDSPEIVGTAFAAALCTYMFVVHSRSTSDPFLPPALFRDRNFVVCTLLMALLGIVLYATIALLTPFMQQLQGYPVLQAGLLVAPRGLGMMLAMGLCPWLMRRTDPRLPVLLAALAMGCAVYSMSGYTADVSGARIAFDTSLQGFGLGMFFVPLGSLAYATLAPELRAEASSLFSVLRNVGASIGISAAFAMLSASARTNHAYLTEGLTAFDSARWAELARDAVGADYARIDAEMARQAAVIAYSNDYTAMLALIMLTLPLVALLRVPRPAPQ